MLAGASALGAQKSPITGSDLLGEMHDAYAGKWFTTLTFTQKTTTKGADGIDKVATWYESLRYVSGAGTQLRIDTGEPSDGNGVLYSSDSTWIFRADKQVAARAGGNALLPLVEGVYVQPVARTIAELKPTAVDLRRPVVSGVWNGRKAWIAGAASAQDTTSPQFWVDAETRAVVRAIFVPVPGAPVMDAHLDKLVPLDGGWLATRCEFYVAGKLVQAEEYDAWKANITLAAALFEPSNWSIAPHWANQRSAPGAGQHPNFAGTWRLDAAKSITPPGLDSFRMTITQRDDTLTAETEAATGQGPVKTSQTLTLDGKPAKNSLATAAGPIDLTSLVTWSGSTMVVTSSGEIQGQTLTQRNEWTLDATGAVLTIKGAVDVAGQHIESTLVLNRQ